MSLLKFTGRSVLVCERCGIKLTDPESIARRMGPECAMTAIAQFNAVSSLTQAITTMTFFDQVAQKFLIEKSIVESRLAKAKSEHNPANIVRFTKDLKRITGILVSREIRRAALQSERQVA